MFHLSLLDLRHRWDHYFWEPEVETAQSPSYRELGGQGAPGPIVDHDDNPLEDLAFFGLLDLGAKGRPNLNTIADLPARDSLDVLGLIGPEGRQSLANASPRDLLKMLSL